MVISGETQASFLSIKGAYVPQSWDLYWTVRRACHSVLGAIAPPKRVNCVPGVEAVAYKQPLVRTMQEAYGEAAFRYIPRSYVLPGQYWVWRSWSQATGSPPELPWVLKANEHRGRGVRVMRQRQAQKAALLGIGRANAASGDPAAGGGAAGGGPQPGYVLVQSYVRQQFLYDSRPSYLRLWVVVTSVRPLRAHLFRGGVLVFGDRIGSGGGGGGAAKGAAAAAAGRRLHQQGVRQKKSQRQKQQKYEMHQVNYWTIEGEKMQPWTVDQLRSYVEAQAAGTAAAVGGSGGPTSDPRVGPGAAAGAWEALWGQARDSVGMVLAAASRRMRSAARGLSALEGSGFEVLGVDFLLNATFHPTLVEVNALPSMARLRTAPGDPAAAAAGNGSTGAASGAGAGGPAAAAADEAAATAPFDMEKERFLSHTLRLIGVPLGPPPPEGTASAAAPPPAAAAAAAVSVGGVLRSFAALLRPPNNETAELQGFLRNHWPADVAAAAAALPRLRRLLCPVPADWGPAPGWPVIGEQQGEQQGAAGAGGAAAAGTAAAAGGRRLAGATGKGGEGQGEGGEAGGRRKVGRSRGWEELRRQVAMGGSPWRVPGPATTAAAPSVAATRQGPVAEQPAVEQQREQASPPPEHGGGEEMAAAAAAAASAAAGAMAGALSLVGGVASAAAAATAKAVGATAAHSSQKRRRMHSADGGGGAGACRQRCYEWDTLAAIADTEYELEQDLDFDPIFPMAAARDLNGAALDAAAAAAAAATAADGAPAATGTAAATAAAAAAGLGDPALLARQTGLQRLQAGLGFVRESFTAVNLDLVRSMRYMTTVPYVLASARLPYTRADAALAAYEAVRRRPGGCITAVAAAAGGGGAADGGVAAAACAVQVLEETLQRLCESAGPDGGGASGAGA